LPPELLMITALLVFAESQYLQNEEKIFKELRSQHVLSRLIHNTCEIEHHHLQEIQPVVS